MAPVTHIVLFQPKPEVSAETTSSVWTALLALKDNCVNPKTKKPYIRSISGGRDNSPEGIQDGISHAFVIEFESAEDRDYYVKEDPAHQAFIRMAVPNMVKAQVIDFTPGAF